MKYYINSRSPFGLKSYLQFFNKLWMQCLVDREFAISYLVDTLIKSESNDYHVEHVECVFEKVRDYSFTLSEEKCEFS